MRTLKKYYRKFLSIRVKGEQYHLLLRPRIIKIERRALFVTVVNCSFLSLANYLSSGDLTGNASTLILQLGNLLLLTALIHFYRAKSEYNYQIVYSLFYIVIFLITAFAPYGEERLLFYYNEELFLLHIILLATQSFRPGRLVGLPVITFLFLHSLLIILLREEMAWSFTHTYRSLVFAWISLIALSMEFILYGFLIRYFEVKKSQKQTRAELLMAETVHNSLFPENFATEKYSITSARRSADILGGDFFDLVRLREGNVGLFFTDISGHGISSAMMSAAMKVILSQVPYHIKLSPEKLFQQLDVIMHKDYESHHATAVYLFFDFIQNEVKVGNAGHPYILRARRGEEFRELETRGSLVGFNIRDPIVDEISLQLQPGDRFLLYTDGLTEFESQNNLSPVEYDINMEEITSGLSELPGHELLDTIMNRIENHPEFNSFRDDVMLLVFDVNGHPTDETTATEDFPPLN